MFSINLEDLEPPLSEDKPSTQEFFSAGALRQTSSSSNFSTNNNEKIALKDVTDDIQNHYRRVFTKTKTRKRESRK